MMVLTLHIRLLGDFSLLYGDQQVTSLNPTRLQSLLTYLVLHRDVPQRRQHLAFLFWPDATEAQARNNLRQLVHQLRQAFPAVEQSCMLIRACCTGASTRHSASMSLSSNMRYIS